MRTGISSHFNRVVCFGFYARSTVVNINWLSVKNKFFTCKFVFRAQIADASGMGA